MDKKEILNKICKLGFTTCSDLKMSYIINNDKTVVASIDNINKVLSISNLNKLEEKRKNKLLNYLLSYLGGG